MPTLSLGTIEVLGLPAAVEAADVALKTADVSLIGYETTDGMGMVAVKIEGQVSAVQSAVSAACAAASRISKVFATSVIPRPSDQLAPVVLTDVTVGLDHQPPAAPTPVPAAPTAELSESQPVVAGTDSDKSVEVEVEAEGEGREEGEGTSVVPAAAEQPPAAHAAPRTRKPATTRTKK
jgi:microcompartment protein CcmL/EutN